MNLLFQFRMTILGACIKKRGLLEIAKSIVRGKTFMRLSGFKANYFDVDTHEEYWISGPKRNGEDGLYGPRPTPIDDAIREGYWTTIRKLPDKKHQETT